MVRQEVRDEVLEVLVTAMEKFHWDNTEISNYMKRELDIRYGVQVPIELVPIISLHSSALDVLGT